MVAGRECFADDTVVSQSALASILLFISRVAGAERYSKKIEHALKAELARIKKRNPTDPFTVR